MGDRGDRRPADALQPHRRDWRRRPLRDSRPAGRDLRRVGPRLRPRRLGQGPGDARIVARSDGRRRAGRRGRGAVLPGRPLAVADRGPRPGRVPRYRSRWQWHRPQHAQPGRMDAHGEVRRVHGVPRARQQGDARGAGGARRVRFDGGGLGPAHPVGAGRRIDVERARPDGAPARDRDVRRLDRPDPGGRAARGAAPAARRRAQRRRDAVGLGRSEGVSPRRDRHRQAQSDRQRVRPDLRRARGERGLRAGARSGGQRFQ